MHINIFPDAMDAAISNTISLQHGSCYRGCARTGNETIVFICFLSRIFAPYANVYACHKNMSLYKKCADYPQLVKRNIIT